MYMFFLGAQVQNAVNLFIAVKSPRLNASDKYARNVPKYFEFPFVFLVLKLKANES